MQEATDVIRHQTSSVLDEVGSSAKVKKKIFGTAGTKINDTPLPKRSRNHPFSFVFCFMFHDLF